MLVLNLINTCSLFPAYPTPTAVEAPSHFIIAFCFTTAEIHRFFHWGVNNVFSEGWDMKGNVD